jgi:hypothetical protein
VLGADLGGRALGPQLTEQIDAQAGRSGEEAMTTSQLRSLGWASPSAVDRNCALANLGKGGRSLSFLAHASRKALAAALIGDRDTPTGPGPESGRFPSPWRIQQKMII